MSKFDLTKVMEAAAGVSQEGGSGRSDLPRLIYPSDGSLVVRLLFNPKSSNVMRLIRRHKIDNQKYDCAVQWGQDCPLCKTIDGIKAVKGLDLWTFKSKPVGIAYAQYVSCSIGYDFGPGRTAPKAGELILLMFPWSVYKQLSEVIQRAGANASEILLDNEGRVVTIIRSLDVKSNRTNYRIELDPFVPKFKSSNSQEEFDAFLEELPDLNESMVPAQMPADLNQKLLAVSEQLNARYLNIAVNPAAQIPSTVYGQTTVNPSPSIAVTPAPPASITATSEDPSPAAAEAIQQEAPVQDNVPSGMPQCFGNLDLRNKDCLVCAHTIECSKASRK